MIDIIAIIGTMYFLQYKKERMEAPGASWGQVSDASQCHLSHIFWFQSHLLFKERDDRFHPLMEGASKSHCNGTSILGCKDYSDHLCRQTYHNFSSQLKYKPNFHYGSQVPTSSDFLFNFVLFHTSLRSLPSFLLLKWPHLVLPVSNAPSSYLGSFLSFRS